MTVLLVLFTLIGFLTVDYFVQKKKKKMLMAEFLQPVQALASQQRHLSEDIQLAHNHAWLRQERDSSVTVGVNDLLSSLLGEVEHIQLPIPGARVDSDSPSFALCDGERQLRFTSPVAGRIVAVNRDLLKTPSLAKSDPYIHGWLFRLLPEEKEPAQWNVLRGEKAITWLKEQTELIKEFLNRHSVQLQFATLQDGGMPIDGVLKGFDADVWREFEREFGTLHRASTTASEKEMKHEYA